MRAAHRAVTRASLVIVMWVAVVGSVVADDFDPVAVRQRAIASLVEKHGPTHRDHIERGVTQAVALWRPEDGGADEFLAFATEHLLVDPAALDSTFAHFEYAFEMMDGHFLSMERELRHWMDEEIGPIQPLDRLLGGFDPSAHLTDDLFENKLAFVALLNYPVTSLEQRLTQGSQWTRRGWAEARLTGRVTERVPAAAQQAVSAATAAADAYVADYNIYMHHVLGKNGRRLFPARLRLISHWGLRDELKARYSEKNGLERQRAIAAVMEAIARQTIPQVVVNNPRVDWTPENRKVTVSKVQDVAPPPGARAAADTTREPDTRYARMLGVFHAMQQVDAATPDVPSHIARTFERDMEIPESEVRRLLEDLFASPAFPEVAALIRKRLGRGLEPFDIWYAGFKPRARYTEAQLDTLTKRRYRTSEDFAADMPRILGGLGFAPDVAKFVASHVVVDPSRGAGHALGGERRGDPSHLRTRVGADGMDYKGYNIAIHEFGHNVEQVFSLERIDHTLLSGVPASAFTEALAFVFQGRDLDLLGIGTEDEKSRAAYALETYWGACEIGAVALVDMDVWHWMYGHPKATPAELRAATVRMAQDVWRRTFGRVMKKQDTALLAVYSHMLAYPLYLSNYPLGHLIEFQLEEHFRYNGDLAGEFERVSRIGNVTPDLWMRTAVGAPLSAKPLTDAAERAVEALQK